MKETLFAFFVSAIVFAAGYAHARNAFKTVRRSLPDVELSYENMTDDEVRAWKLEDTKTGVVCYAITGLRDTERKNGIIPTLSCIKVQ